MRLDLKREKSMRPNSYLYSRCKVCNQLISAGVRTSLGFAGDVCKDLSKCLEPIKNTELRKSYRRK